MSDTNVPTTDELKLRLTPMQFHVTQEAGTERPFTGEFWDTKDPGTYHCIVCDEQLFDSGTKFDAHCGWPSFYESLGTDKIEYIEDRTLGPPRARVPRRSASDRQSLLHQLRQPRPDAPPRLSSDGHSPLSPGSSPTRRPGCRNPSP
jgi:methionine-R-sulfoxide reductase